MPAIRIIDDHLELDNIGSNTHTQIDTHIAAANDYIKRDGSLELTADWDIGDTRKIKADEIRARGGAGLKLYDDAGQGIFVEDGGQVGIGTILPVSTLHIKGDTGWQILESDGVGKDSAMRFKTNAGAQYWQYVMEGHAAGGTVGAQNNFGFLYNPDGGVVENVIVVFQPNGNVGFGTNAPTAKLDINSDIFRVRTAKTPASASASGNIGDICWDTNYTYVCTATNTWKRQPLAWDTNIYDDAAVTKLSGIETEATTDQTGAEIKTLYEVQANAYTDTKDTKLASIETSATADQTGGEIKIAYEAGGVGVGTPTELTLDSSGTITPTRSRHQIDTYEDAVTDNLDHIYTTNMTDGDMIYLTTAIASRDVTVRDNSVGGGNIYLEGDVSFVMAGTQHLIGMMLIDIPISGLRWVEMFRFNG